MRNKAEATKAHILGHALAILKNEGIQSVTLGNVAKSSGVSKSGILTRFGRQEQLLISTIRLYRIEFSRTVMAPAGGAPPGLKRLEAMFANIERAVKSDPTFGCLHRVSFASLIPYPSATHNEVALLSHDCCAGIHHFLKHAIRKRELTSELDIDQLTFEVFGLLMLFLYEASAHPLASVKPRTLLALQRLLVPYRCIGTPRSIVAENSYNETMEIV